MARLNTSTNVHRHDDIYQMFVDLHEGCDQKESNRRNARLILCLANQIGDAGIISEAVEIARRHGAECE